MPNEKEQIKTSQLQVNVSHIPDSENPIEFISVNIKKSTGPQLQKDEFFAGRVKYEDFDEADKNIYDQFLSMIKKHVQKQM